jgi:peptidoglycan pentaglycine glycine transferase (the first glycine)
MQRAKMQKADGIQPQAWNEVVASLPGAHVLQTWEWAQVKSHFGWQPDPRLWLDSSGKVVAAAMLLHRAIPMRGFSARLRVIYAPKGPLLDWNEPLLRRCVLDDLAKMAYKQGGIFIKIDPDVDLGTGSPGEESATEDPLGQAVTADLKETGWLFSDEQIQFRNTVLIDLHPDEQALLANMKQKTRYNIRLAERKGVCVRPGGRADLEALYKLYAETSARDGFVIREEAYYHAVWETFLQAGIAEPLIAEVDGEMVAGVIIFRFASQAWYLYGMSTAEHREKMPNHLLQWEAMRCARTDGCQVYDMWGAPDVFAESDPLWGVYRFKEGFGGQVVRRLGAWDLPLRPLFYRLYTQILPRLLGMMRRRGKQRTLRSLAPGS